MNIETSVPIVAESAWVKSSYSSGAGGECVEVAAHPDSVHIRDSKDTAGPILSVPSDGWKAFVEFATRG